jgi:hypothetical protein
MTNNLIILAVLAALIGGAIVVARLYKTRTKAKSPATQEDADFPPKPKWRPTIPVNIARTIEAFCYYTDRKKTFAVFANGTCVLLPDGTSQPEKDAKEILNKVYNYHPDFKPQSMDDGNFLVSYSQPAFSVVFKDEVEKNQAYIDKNHLDGVVRAEVLLNAKGEANKFDQMGKIGLFGRARMFLDAQNPVVVRVWKP